MEELVQSYLNKLSGGFDDFITFMEDSNSGKKRPDITVEEQLEIIDKQKNVVSKVLKHSIFYKNHFFNKIFSELYKQIIKKTVKAEVQLYCSDVYKKQASIMENTYFKLPVDYTDLVQDANLHVGSFIDTLALLEDNLNKQVVILSNEAKILDQSSDEIFSSVKKVSQKIQNKVLGSFDKSLVEEEKLIQTFISTLPIDDVNELYEFEKFLQSKIFKGMFIKMGIGLNVLPEAAGVSEGGAAICYIFAGIAHLNIINSKFNKPIPPKDELKK